MNTIGGTTVNLVSHEELYAIAHSFECTASVEKSCIVKMNNDGTVSPVEAVTDKPFGMVTVGCKNADEKVTVLSPYVAIVKGYADGVIDEGEYVNAKAWEATEGKMEYKVAAAASHAVGQCIIGGADNTEVTIGILRVPVTQPAA